MLFNHTHAVTLHCFIWPAKNLEYGGPRGSCCLVGKVAHNLHVQYFFFFRYASHRKHYPGNFPFIPIPAFRIKNWIYADYLSLSFFLGYGVPPKHSPLPLRSLLRLVVLELILSFLDHHYMK